MSRRRLSLLSILSALVLLTVFPAPAFADEFVCEGAVGATTLDNVKVPDGATCTLTGTTVQGTIKVEKGTLTATNVKVVGNIQADGHLNVRVNGGSTVGGSIQIKQGGSASITGVTVNGDIQFEHNTGAVVASANNVGGSIQVVGNGAADITNNTMKGNLQCKENNPGPTGGGNIVGGNAEDQCANFGGGGEGISAGSATTGSTPSVLGARAGFARLWLMNGPSFFLQIL